MHIITIQEANGYDLEALMEQAFAKDTGFCGPAFSAGRDDATDKAMRKHLKKMGAVERREFWKAMALRCMDPAGCRTNGIKQVRDLYNWAEEQGFPF